MLLRKKIVTSFLFLTALINLRPQWKSVLIVELSASSSAIATSTSNGDWLWTSDFSTTIVEPFKNGSGWDSSEMIAFENEVNMSQSGRRTANQNAKSKLLHDVAGTKAATTTTTTSSTTGSERRIAPLPFSVPTFGIENIAPLTATMMPSNPRLYFIHIGKAGGLTLNLIVDTQGKRKALDCFIERSKMNPNKEPSSQGKNENRTSNHHLASSPPCYINRKGSQYSSQLSHHTMSHLHLFGARFSKLQRQWILDNTNTFLFLLRDPIDRIVSAYNFHRHNFAKTSKPKRKAFYQTCFPSGMDDLVNVLRRGRHLEQNEDNRRRIKNATLCQSIGIQALRGQRLSGAGNHFHFNYGYYARKTIALKPNHSVAVIRTEHMWEDVIALDRSLGGAGNFSQVGAKISHGSESWKGTQKYDSYLSEENLQLLCCFLRRELDVYQKLVLLAANLNDAQKRDTLTAALTHCQIDYAGDPIKQPFRWHSYYDTACVPLAQEVMPVTVW